MQDKETTLKFLKNALESFSKTSYGFVRLKDSLGVLYYCGIYDTERIKVKDIIPEIARVFDDIMLLVYRIEERDRERKLEVKLGKTREVDHEWFMALDAKYIHFEIRSLMDKIAKVIKMNSLRPGVLPESYNDLLNGLEKKNYKKQIPELYPLIVSSKSWFDLIRDIRDDFVHRQVTSHIACLDELYMFGHKNIPKEKKDDIQYVLAKGFYGDRIISQEFRNKYPEVDLDSLKQYLTIIIANLVIFMKDLTKILVTKSTLSPKKDQPICLGCQTYVKWLQDLVKKIET